MNIHFVNCISISCVMGNKNNLGLKENLQNVNRYLLNIFGIKNYRCFINFNNIRKKNV